MKCRRSECIYNSDLGLCHNDRVELDVIGQCCAVLTRQELWEAATDGEDIPAIFDRDAIIEAGPEAVLEEVVVVGPSPGPISLLVASATAFFCYEVYVRGGVGPPENRSGWIKSLMVGDEGDLREKIERLRSRGFRFRELAFFPGGSEDVTVLD